MKADSYVQVVWGGGSIYPDWFNPAVQEYWNGEFARFFSAESGVDIDGLWIDMNVSQPRLAALEV